MRIAECKVCKTLLTGTGMDAAPLRIALLGTPRSGNTWLRMLVGAAVGIPTTAVHELTDAVLADLPPECIVQIHWRRDPAFLQLLDASGFRVLTVARHPLDVLISILQFAIHESESDRWLLGRAGDESGIFGAMPRSRAFVEYATGERAKELFGVTADWWNYPGAVTARYEDLVRDPVGELRRLVDRFSAESTPDLAEIASRHDLQTLRKTSFNNHFWKGMPGLWRHLLTVEAAREIAGAHAEHFELLNYTANADPALNDSAADRNWIAASGPSLRAALRRAAASHVEEREGLRAEGEALRAELDALRAEKDRFALQLHLAKVEAAQARAKMVPFEGLQGFSVKVARTVQSVRNRLRPNRPR